MSFSYLFSNHLCRMLYLPTSSYDFMLQHWMTVRLHTQNHTQHQQRKTHWNIIYYLFTIFEMPSYLSLSLPFSWQLMIFLLCCANRSLFGLDSLDLFLRPFCGNAKQSSQHLHPPNRFYVIVLCLWWLLMLLLLLLLLLFLIISIFSERNHVILSMENPWIFSTNITLTHTQPTFCRMFDSLNCFDLLL